MSVNPEDVKHIALLSRLELSDEEVQLYTGHLRGILTYVEKLQSINVSQVEPLSHAVPLSNVFAEDVVRPSLPIEEVLANAPEKEDRCFRVPRVTE